MCSYSWRVPSHAFGELKIVASGDIGDLGPKEGTGITYNWSILYNVAGWLPWLLVIAALVLLKENRRGAAYLILLPVLVFKGILCGIIALMARFANMPSEIAMLFHTLADCLLVGFVLNWLLGERIGNRNRFVTWLLAIVIFAITWAVSLVSMGTGREAMQISIFIGMTVAILMLSFPLSGFKCRKAFGPVKFCLWMALWVVVFTYGLFLTVALIQSAFTGWKYIGQMLLAISIGGGIYSGILIVALLPFEILLLANGFWRKRFEAVFGLKAPAPPTFEADVPDFSEASPEE